MDSFTKTCLLAVGIFFGLAACAGKDVTLLSLDQRQIAVGDAETDVSEFAWSGDGRRVAVLGALVRKITVFDVAAGKSVAVLDDLAGGASSLAFLSDGSILCAPRGSPGSAASIWSPDSGSLAFLPGPSGGSDTLANMLSSFSLDRDSGRLLGIFRTRAGDRVILHLAIYDAASAKLLASRVLPATAVAVAPGGAQAAIVGQSGQIDIIDLNSGNMLRHIDANHNRVEQIGWSPDGKWLVTGTSPQGYGLDPATGKYGPLRDTSLLQVWDAQSGQKVAAAAGIANAVRSLDISRDGRLVAAALSDGTVRILKLADLAEIARMPETGKPTDMRVRFSPDSRQLGGVAARPSAFGNSRCFAVDLWSG